MYTGAYIQGDVGEVITASELRSKCGMLVARNLYFNRDSKFIEVDMVGVSKLGLFVIENKNYCGTVTGDINDYYWSVRYSIYREEKLFNPVKQNLLHKNALLDQLRGTSFEDIPIYKPVIFNNKTSLDLTNCNKSVFNLDDFIRIYNSVDIDLVSKERQQEVFNYLKQWSNQSEEMRLLHLSMLRGEICKKHQK